jgi:hypothetical protein
VSRYKIAMQTEGRGDKAKSVPIKRVKFRPEANKAKPLEKPSFKPIKFPMLKVCLDRAGMKGVLEVAWSNHKGSFGANPGKFKFRHVVMQPIVVHLKNANGRVATQNGKPIVDYVTMTKNYGTELVAGELVYGESHPQERVVKWELEAETLQGIVSLIQGKLGEPLAATVMTLFVAHPLFQAFFSTAQRKAA